MTDSNNRKPEENKKIRQLEKFYRENEGKPMTTDESVKISDDENTLSAGDRGPQLLEDFIYREKLSHFDRERIPERNVHARGYGAHGIFECYESQADLTDAHFLQEAGRKTPTFVRFSQVAGSRGANETLRDVRGFATKFYTEEGNFDLVGNNIPIFFIQDGIKFPDLIHALKPEPNNEIPQGQTAHDTFWDFIGSNEESAAMMMWIMSDRTIPRSFRMIQGFGVHTFRLVNKEGVSHFCKFHWRPTLGVHSLIWDEAQKIGGADPDFHRRDLWENINKGNFPEYELGIQVIREDQEFDFDFDILDATKLWPEELIPLKKIGKMTLNKNVENVFAETEQVALHPGNIVRGIDFTNDPLLQGRLFSYADTQFYRVGTNFKQIPINCPIHTAHNNHRDGAARYVIDKGQVAYHQNYLADNTPYTVPGDKGGFVTYPSLVEGKKVRKTAPSFEDHFSQAKLFWNSMSDVEKSHILQAFSFELGKVKTPAVRERVIRMLAHISRPLAVSVAEQVGVPAPPEDIQESDVTASSPALSMRNTIFTADTLKVGVIIDEQYDSNALEAAMASWKKAGLQPVFVSSKLGTLQGTGGDTISVDDTFLTGSPLLYDGLFVIGGPYATRDFHFMANQFIVDQFNHYKPIGGIGEGAEWIEEIHLQDRPGVLASKSPNEGFYKAFVNAMAKQRFWNR
ncbi:catalase [Oceanobacillus sojae]|uniref:Catalase n=1 Tax=Oceanobacillus sojae TaxID=582851 RepID=A0A511ZJL7_9BACI|nr:catalase [Oceanobacillus sojae]GEN87654.1 catalase HPII [Oceanobacillus sojae]